MEGRKGHVGKLGTLLGGFEEEREAERVRTIRRREAELREELPEEDEDTDEEEEEENVAVAAQAEENLEEMKKWFLRLIKEKFIYGLLEVCQGTFIPVLDVLNSLSFRISTTTRLTGTIVGTSTIIGT